MHPAWVKAQLGRSGAIAPRSWTKAPQTDKALEVPRWADGATFEFSGRLVGGLEIPRWADGATYEFSGRLGGGLEIPRWADVAIYIFPGGLSGELDMRFLGRQSDL